MNEESKHSSVIKRKKLFTKVNKGKLDLTQYKMNDKKFKNNNSKRKGPDISVSTGNMPMQASEYPLNMENIKNIVSRNQKLLKISDQNKDLKNDTIMMNYPLLLHKIENSVSNEVDKKENRQDSPKNKSQKSLLVTVKNERPLKDPNKSVSFMEKPFPLLSETSLSMIQELEKEPWFHGILSKSDIKDLLTTSGSFLVRIDLLNVKKGKLMLSCKWNTKRVHFVLTIKGSEVILFDQRSTSVSSLVNKLVTDKIPIHPEYKIILQTPVLQQRWEINNNSIGLVKKIGQGTFGDIWKATMKQGNGKPNITVAVKIPKTRNLDKFISIVTEALSEVRFMRAFEHDNIVKFYGSSFISEPFMIVMELSIYGCLQKFIKRRKKKLNDKDLLKFAIDASVGIAYVHSKLGIHRDIAARNCLVFSNNKVKISDFGQAVILKNGQKEFKLENKDSLLPLRWLSAETLKSSIFSQKTDVYSFGIMLWEIFNCCKEPFGSLTVGEIVIGIRKGQKPKSASTVPMEIVDLIEKKCLQIDPSKRPTMNEVTKILKDINSRVVKSSPTVKNN